MGAEATKKERILEGANSMFCTALAQEIWANCIRTLYFVQ
jgi:hypothetical protein